MGEKFNCGLDGGQDMEHNWDSVRLGGEQGDILLVEWERGDAEVKE